MFVILLLMAVVLIPVKPEQTFRLCTTSTINTQETFTESVV